MSGEVMVASVSAPGGVVPSATSGPIAIPAWRSEPASASAASFAGSEAKPPARGSL